MRTLTLIAALAVTAVLPAAATAKTWKGGQTASYTVKKDLHPDGNPAYRVHVRVPKGFTMTVRTSKGGPELTLGKVGSKRVCGGLAGAVQYLDGMSFADALLRDNHTDSLLGAPTASDRITDTVSWVEFAHPAVAGQWVDYAISRRFHQRDSASGLIRYYGFAVGSGCLSRGRARTMAKSARFEEAS